MNDNSIEWKDFQMSVDLHKYYLDLSIKINLFYYAITGAIISFHFTQDDNEITQLGLLLPILLSISFGIFFIYSAKLAKNLRKNIKERALRLNLDIYPEGIVLVLTCYIFGTIMLIVGISILTYVLFRILS